MRKLGIRPGMLLRVRIGPALHRPTFPHTSQWVFFGGPLAASQGRTARLRAAQRKTGKLARLSKTLDREDGRARWLAKGKWGRF
jgi:hypothetical protein